MSVTRAAVEQVLVARRGPFMTASGMAITYAGANADLNDPIGYAVRYFGGTVTSLLAVADADLATVDDAYLDGILDVSELRLLYSIKGHLDDVDSRVGPLSVSLSQLADSVDQDIANLTKSIISKYGLGGTTMIATGYLTLDFAEHNDPLPGESE